MGNSFFIGVMVFFLTLTIGSLTAFAIGRLRIGMGWLLSNAALLTYVIPMSFLTIPFYGIMRKYGLADNAWSVIAVEVTFATPYAIFIFTQYGSSIPRELDEAARIDGASLWQELMLVMLPMAVPGLVSTVLLCLIFTWNEFFIAFNLTITKVPPLTVYIVGFKTSEGLFWAKMSAAATVSALPVIIAGWVAQRQMVRGLTAGAIK